jgi:ankyrin repeat protein
VAALRGKIHMVTYLLDKADADIDERDENEDTPLLLVYHFKKAKLDPINWMMVHKCLNVNRLHLIINGMWYVI